MSENNIQFLPCYYQVFIECIMFVRVFVEIVTIKAMFIDNVHRSHNNKCS